MLTFAHFGTILLLNISWIYICNNPPPPPPLDISENSSLLVYPTGMAFLGRKFVSRELKLKLQSSGSFAKMPSPSGRWSPSENIAYDGFFSTVLLAVPGCTRLYLAVPGSVEVCYGHWPLVMVLTQTATDCYCLNDWVYTGFNAQKL